MLVRVAVLLSFLSLALPAKAEDRQSFFGAWDLTLVETTDENGQWHDIAPEGTKFVGILMYSSSGKMQAQLYLSDRNHEFFKDFSDEFVDGYIAYYGDYSVDDIDKVVTHKRLGHISAGSPRDAQRSYVFRDDLLILSLLPERNLRLIWKRVAQ